MKTKRDEWSCPCCGVGNDGSYCEACIAFECGERDYNDPNIEKCLVPKGVCVWRSRHAGHYEGGGGHDLLTVEVTQPAGAETRFTKHGTPDVRPAGLPSEFRFHSGHREPDGVQRWRFVSTAPLSPGKCVRCGP